MLMKNRHLYFWYLLVGAIALLAIVPDNSSLYHTISDYDSNRWAHFLEYALIAAIPVGAWGRRTDAALSFIPIFLCIVIEALHVQFPGPVVRTNNISADLFGAAAGILLGLNIRVIRNSETVREVGKSDPSHSASN